MGALSPGAYAVELLMRVDKDAARNLSALLNLKTKSGYSHTPVTVAEFKRAGWGGCGTCRGCPPRSGIRRHLNTEAS